ncbi:hypothetical protein BVY01_00925 [bacterium I07]|nr:hypothetical protein BVY01_00925 [bacterium I07]
MLEKLLTDFFIITLSFVIFGVVCAIICADIAESRGRQPRRWFVAGFILGPLGILLLFMLPKNDNSAGKGDTPNLKEND